MNTTNKHDKISFTREYCLCRRIPYRIVQEHLIIGGYNVCFSLYNLPYKEIIDMIDKFVEYNEYGWFVRVNPKSIW
jgi:hypothetical protein